MLEEIHNLFKKSDMIGTTWRAPLGMGPLWKSSHLGRLKRVAFVVSFLCQEDCYIWGWDGGEYIDKLNLLIGLKKLLFSWGKYKLYTQTVKNKQGSVGDMPKEWPGHVNR